MSLKFHCDNCGKETPTSEIRRVEMSIYHIEGNDITGHNIDEHREIIYGEHLCHDCRNQHTTTTLEEKDFLKGNSKKEKQKP